MGHITIDQLIRDSFRCASEHGWHDELRSYGDIIALIHSELSEALEAYREGNHPTMVTFDASGKPCGIPIELADAVIRIADMCGVYEIDLSAAIRQKMWYNEGREYRHGGKRL